MNNACRKCVNNAKLFSNWCRQCIFYMREVAWFTTCILWASTWKTFNVYIGSVFRQAILNPKSLTGDVKTWKFLHKINSSSMRILMSTLYTKWISYWFVYSCFPRIFEFRLCGITVLVVSMRSRFRNPNMFVGFIILTIMLSCLNTLLTIRLGGGQDYNRV